MQCTQPRPYRSPRLLDAAVLLRRLELEQKEGPKADGEGQLNQHRRCWRESGETYIPSGLRMPTSTKAALVSARHKDQPLLLSIQLGRELALPVADIDTLNSALRNIGSTGLYRSLVGKEALGLIKPFGGLSNKRHLVCRHQ